MNDNIIRDFSFLYKRVSFNGLIDGLMDKIVIIVIVNWEIVIGWMDGCSVMRFMYRRDY
jgi:hypothetical protein